MSEHGEKPQSIETSESNTTETSNSWLNTLKAKLDKNATQLLGGAAMGTGLLATTSGVLFLASSFTNGMSPEQMLNGMVLMDIGMKSYKASEEYRPDWRQQTREELRHEQEGAE